MINQIVAIGDIDNRTFYHVGDEAMLEANLIQLRDHAPQLQITLISGAPDASADFYHLPTVPRLGFASQAKHHEQYLESVLQVAQTRLAGPTEPFHATIEALYQADALLISGGGNISSTWPEHLYERIALIKIAALFQKQIIMTGQTIGPVLTDNERQLLSTALPQVALLGVRERPSAQLVKQLGISAEKIDFQLDDAFYLPPQPIEQPLPFDISQPFIAVTISPYTNPETNSQSLDLLATQLQAVSQLTNAPLVFIPHVGEVHNSPFSDVTIAHYLKTKINIIDLPVYTAREVVWLTSQAALVISTRYHPIVFGIAAQVPCLGLYLDDYTRIKLTGALAHAGLAEWAMPIEAAVHGLLIDAVQELWSRRAEIKQHLAMCQPYWQHMYTAHWSRLLETLALPNADPNSPTPASLPTHPTPTGHWLKAAQILDAAKHDWDLQLAQHKASFSRVEEYALTLEKAFADQQANIEPLQSIIQAREVEIAALHEVLAATQDILQLREAELAKIKAFLPTHLIRKLNRLLASRHED